MADYNPPYELVFANLHVAAARRLDDDNDESA
jgi:hypothetical protein